MTDPNQPPPYDPNAAPPVPPAASPAPPAPPVPPAPPAYAPPPPPAQPGQYSPPPQYGAPGVVAGYGPVGQIRGTGISILLAIVTLGIYTLVWYYKTSEEMKQHSGQGLGGPLAVVLAFFIGVASPFLTAGEVGALYERQGRPKPVSGTTGLWYIPGFLIIVGPIVWFVKTNGALNEYWKSMGAQA